MVNYTGKDQGNIYLPKCMQLLCQFCYFSTSPIVTFKGMQSILDVLFSSIFCWCFPLKLHTHLESPNIFLYFAAVSINPLI